MFPLAHFLALLGGGATAFSPIKAMVGRTYMWVKDRKVIVILLIYSVEASNKDQALLMGINQLWSVLGAERGIVQCGLSNRSSGMSCSLCKKSYSLCEKSFAD